jgi:hypothetical protein
VAWPLLLYGGLALLMWGPWVLDDPSSKLLAANDLDPSAYLWFFAWWPHALLNGLDPFYTELIFVPDGYNLAWVTSMPGPSQLLSPVTLALGPEITFNLISFAAPALAAWTAFLLCRHLTGSVPASLVGGYVFGFSPYMLSQLRGAPQLALVALVPVIALLVLRHVQGSLPDRRFVLALTATLTAQILTSTEILATALLFGALVMLAAYALYGELRARLRRTALLCGAALGGTALLASPLLYNVFFRERTLPEQALTDFPADLLSFLVPGPLVAAAPERVGAMQPSWATGPAYLGPPLLALLAAFAVRYRRDRRALLVLVAFAVPAVAALGTYLHVGGTDTGIPMPWLAFDSLPLLRYAIPLRFPAFAFLAAGVAAAMWLDRRPTRARWAFALVAVACLLPAVGNDDWHTRLAELPFFTGDGHERRLEQSDHVLTVPTWGHNMHWHVQADFSFGLAAGYVGAFPESYRRFAAWRDLLGSPLGRDGVPSPGELRRFIRAKGVTAIVVERDRPGGGRELFRSLGVPPVGIGGVLLYRLAPPPG